LGPGLLVVAQYLQLEEPHDPSCCDIAAVQPQLRAKLAATSNRRQERNSKKIQPLREKLRILTGARPRSIRPALVRGRSACVGSVIKKRRKKMRKHKKKKLLKRSRHKRK
jgi:hypothetical protein